MHPDTERLLVELRRIPAFRAQEIAAKTKGINVDLQIARCLETIDETLQTLGRLYFVKYPGEEKAPYAVFLLYNVDTSLHDLMVQVGNAAINAMRRNAAAQVMSGMIGRTPRMPHEPVRQ